jgi:methionine biosynthesis protein MetW
MAILSIFSRIYRSIYGPMPLDDFPDYNEYWNRRSRDTPSPDVLHRFVSVADRIPDGMSVLDIGCGDGAFLAYLKNRRTRCSVFGMDISAKAVALLQQRGIEGVAITHPDQLRKHTARDFDYVVLMEVIEHVHDAENLFRQALQFKPKMVFVTIPNAGYLMHRLRLMFGGRFPLTFIVYHVKEHIRFWTVKDFVQWTESLGCATRRYAGQERSKNPLRNFLIRRFPALFAAQMIYEVEPIRQACTHDSFHSPVNPCR